MKISVITVCLNSVDTIEHTIKSVLQQTYCNIEYIVIDGGSSDGTLEILKKYGSRITKIISEKDSGIFSAINKGIKIASGDIISILHSNDIFNNKYTLENISKSFIKNKCEVLLSNIFFKRDFKNNSILRYYSSRYFKKKLLKFGVSPPHTGTFIKKSIYSHTIYNENYLIAGDFDFFVKIFLIKDLNFYYHDEYTVIMLDGGKSTSGLKSYLISTKEILKSLNDNLIYSNLFMVLLRLPYKFFIKYLK